MLTASLLTAVFLGALVSGWHCALMCGGIAAAIERPTASQVPLKTKSALLYDQLIMHLGRISTYVLLGAFAAWIGVVVWQQNVLPIQRALFVLTSILLFVMGVRLLNVGGSGARIGGRWLGARIANYWAKYLGRFANSPSRWFSGMLWEIGRAHV